MAIDLDVVTRLNKSTAREAAREAQQYFERAGRDSGEDFGDNFSKGLTSKIPEVQKAYDKVTSASGKLIVEQEKLNALQDKGTASKAQLVAQSEKVAKAFRDEENAIRNVGTVMDNLTPSASAAGTSVAELGQQLAGIGRLAGPGLMVGAVAAFGQLAGAAAQLSGVIGILPGALGAAAVGFGTLKVATLGFSDAMDSLRDPEKFAEALKALSPNAQEAATSIQALIPAFDQVKNAAQDALFNGVGQQLTNLASTFLPTIQSATTGIAAAFNQMFSGVTTQLLTPETQASIQGFLTNVQGAFTALAPSLGSLTSAFSTLADVGSSFLPGIAAGASQAAASFADFLSAAQQSGQLRQWMQDGLTAIQQLWPAVEALGDAFMKIANDNQGGMENLVKAFEGIAAILPTVVQGCQDLVAPLGAVLTIAGDLRGAFEVFGASGKQSADIADGAFKALKDTLFQVLSPLKAIADVYAQIRGLFNHDTLNDAVNQLRTAQGNAAANAPAWGGTGGPGGMGGVALGAGLGGTGTGLPGGFVGAPGGIGLGTGFSVQSRGAHEGFYSPPKSTTGGGAAVTPYVDPGKFMGGDPLAGLPGAIPGSDPAAIYAADSRLVTASHNLEQGKLALQVLEAKGNATQQELLTAKNNIQEQERALYKAQSDDLEARSSQIKQAVGDLKSVFAPLDQDFGVSKGLPGIVENLTKLLGNFAFGGAIRSSPELQGGVMALMQNRGVAPGLFNQNLFAGQGSAGFNAGAPTGFPTSLPTALPGTRMAGSYGLPAGTNSGGYGGGGAAFPDWVNQVGAAFGIKPSTYPGHQESDRHEAGFAPNPNHENRAIDWTGPTASLQRFAEYLDSIPQDLEQVIWQNPGTGQRIGVAGGQDVSGSGYYAGDYGGHQNHVHTRQSAPIPLPSAMGPAPIGGGLGPSVAYPGASPAPPWSPGPSIPSGMGGGGPLFMGGGMPSAMPGGAGPGVGASNYSAMQSFAPPASPGGSGGAGGGGGLLGAAASAFPGGQQGAALAMRGIQFAGQAASIGVSGLLETFLPHDSQLAGNSWLGKLAGGFSGARPASPNQAGTPAPPQQGDPQQGGNQDNSTNINIANMDTGGKDGQAVSQDLARASYSAGQPR